MIYRTALVLTVVVSLASCAPARAETDELERQVRIHHMLVDINLKNGKLDEVLNQYKVLLTLKPGNETLQNKFANFLSRKYSDHQRSEIELRNLLNTEPKNKHYLQALVTVLVKLGKTDEAQLILKKQEKEALPDLSKN